MWRGLWMSALITLPPLAALGVWLFTQPIHAINTLTQAQLSVQGRLGPVQLDQAYGSDIAQRADVYWPPASAQRPPQGWPVVVFFHGGSWVRGHRSEYRFVGQSLASRGVIAVLADYRLYPQVKYPEFLRDSANVTAWALRQAGVWGANPDRLYLMGHSAGAYNAAMLAVDKRWLQEAGASQHQVAGWIGLAGPYDFLPIQDEEVKPVFDFPNSPPDSQVLFHDLRGSPPAWLAMAPVDPYVNPEINSIRLYRRLQAVGVSSQLLSVPRASHISMVAMLSPLFRAWVPLLDDVMAFVGLPQTSQQAQAPRGTLPHSTQSDASALP
jgi:acetyl esterase/lipase